MNIIVRNKLKEILAQKGIKQIWLADQLQVDKSTISHIVNNRFTTSLEMAFKISIVLNLDITDIFYYKKVE